MASSRFPVIGVTMGDPSGIGPEIVLRALAAKGLRRSCHFVVIGSAPILCEVSRRLSFDASFLNDDVQLIGVGAVPRRLAMLGEATAEGGRASIAFVERGISMAMSSRIHALVTAPINKQAVAMATLPWPGHTELLREKTGARNALMVMVGGGLRVGLVTAHLAMSAVPRAITRARVSRAISTLNDGLRDCFGIAAPRIAVCGLNPHSGEAGRFGNEEKRAVIPAITAAAADGISCSGPVPADVAFRQAIEGRYDGVVAMYHDQGCIPVKLLAFETGVNVTLGLPIIRTSPDHGTAYDIVREGRADPRSMIAAIRLAVEMARRRRTTHTGGA